MEKYLIYCDESDRKGEKYSYFLGNIILQDVKLLEAQRYLLDLIQDYSGELKWCKISNSNNDLNVYSKFINAIFDLIEAEIVKVRIFFVPNIFLNAYKNQHEEISFFKLYYTFLIHTGKFFNIKAILLDRLPIQTKEEVYKFKNYIYIYKYYF